MFTSVLKNCLIRQPLRKPTLFLKTNIKFMGSLRNSTNNLPMVPISCLFTSKPNIGNSTTNAVSIREPIVQDQNTLQDVGILVDSVKRKRKTMMKKHKLRKRRKSAKAERRKKSQGN